jgi:DNA-binding transcriptional MerR regulator
MRLLEVLDAALALGVSPATVRRLADEGKLPLAAETRRGQRLFDPGEVERVKRDRAQRRSGAAA